MGLVKKVSQERGIKPLDLKKYMYYSYIQATKLPSMTNETLPSIEDPE